MTVLTNVFEPSIAQSLPDDDGPERLTCSDGTIGSCSRHSCHTVSSRTKHRKCRLSRCRNRSPQPHTSSRAQRQREREGTVRDDGGRRHGNTERRTHVESSTAATGNLRMIEGRLYWTSIPEARTIWDERYAPLLSRKALAVSRTVSIAACILRGIDVCGISVFSIMPAP